MKKLKFDPENWDWYAFLDASNVIKEEFKREAFSLSSDWITCACGQVCDVLPKGLYSSPLDEEASGLGMDFCDLICDEDWENAKTTLDKIEKRTIFLLKQPNFIDPKTL